MCYYIFLIHSVNKIYFIIFIIQKNNIKRNIRLICYCLHFSSIIGNTPSIETSETDTTGTSITRRSSSGGLLSPEVELGGKYMQQFLILYKISTENF